ncbi:nuclear transcription factor Y subunit A-7-like [Andrographis paniculata]|uniref:nuclear transcription factor Y subunit A-7-like n=1 Tax=Andrographis paniculata TaxID=175694 RepID=UPI0021E84AC1|nr:nuclear transcription factor Y subunit A-7-like [Andrographis paniculata]
MTSSIHGLSDNGEADEEQKHAETPLQHMSPVNGFPHTGIASPTMQYAAPAQIGVGNAQTAYPYPDPYYRSIFAPYDTRPYAAQPYPVQPMLMGMQQAGVPLPSEAVDEPVFVNAKQYHGILRRRQSRLKAESEKKQSKSRKPYLHESRHLHAVRRARGVGGRFEKKIDKQKQETQPSEESQNSSGCDDPTRVSPEGLA